MLTLATVSCVNFPEKTGHLSCSSFLKLFIVSVKIPTSVFQGATASVHLTPKLFNGTEGSSGVLERDVRF